MGFKLLGMGSRVPKGWEPLQVYKVCLTKQDVLACRIQDVRTS